MELTNEFEVSVPVDEAWTVLTDLERIAPCLPGAELQEVDGDEYRGVVKVKVGPITAQYKGKAVFVERDEVGHVAKLSASGRDTRGQGNAAAAITAQLTGHDGTTHVSLLTDLTITGKVAQFGRGVLGDVSAKLLDQFVENLESTVLASRDGSPGSSTTSAGAPPDSSSDSSTGSAPERREGPPVGIAAEGSVAPGSTSPSGSSTPPLTPAEREPAQPVDLLDVAGSSVLKRLAPLVVVGGVVVVGVVLVRRRRRG